MESGQIRRPWAFATAVLGVAMLAIYVTLIVAQGGVRLFEVLPWVLLMAIAAIAAFAAARIEDWRFARNVMVAAAILFAMLGVVSILSIGIGFLLTAALATIAAIRIATAKPV